MIGGLLLEVMTCHEWVHHISHPTRRRLVDSRESLARVASSSSARPRASARIRALGRYVLLERARAVVGVVGGVDVDETTDGGRCRRRRRRRPPSRASRARALASASASMVNDSASASDGATAMVTEPKTGLRVPAEMTPGARRSLAGLGVRVKRIAGLGVKVYACGFYIDAGAMRGMKADETMGADAFEALARCGEALDWSSRETSAAIRLSRRSPSAFDRR